MEDHLTLPKPSLAYRIGLGLLGIRVVDAGARHVVFRSPKWLGPAAPLAMAQRIASRDERGVLRVTTTDRFVRVERVAA